MTRIRLPDGAIAELDNGEIRAPDEWRVLLRQALPADGPRAADSDPELVLARDLARNYGGEIIAHEPDEIPEGLVR